MEPSEEWAQIPGWEGYYSVSNMGRVRSDPRTLTDVTGRVRLFKGRLIAMAFNPGGYVQANLCRDGKIKTHVVHQLVLIAFVSPRPDGMEALHRNGNPADARLSNLRWGTPSENIRDQVIHGTHNMATRTHCPREHALVHPNLVAAVAKQGRRGCLACNRGFATVATARKRGIDLDLTEQADLHYLKIMGSTPAAA